MSMFKKGTEVLKTASTVVVTLTLTLIGVQSCSKNSPGISEKLDLDNIETTETFNQQPVPQYEQQTINQQPFVVDSLKDKLHLSEIRKANDEAYFDEKRKRTQAFIDECERMNLDAAKAATRLNMQSMGQVDPLETFRNTSKRIHESRFSDAEIAHFSNLKQRLQNDEKLTIEELRQLAIFNGNQQAFDNAMYSISNHIKFCNFFGNVRKGFQYGSFPAFNDMVNTIPENRRENKYVTDTEAIYFYLKDAATTNTGHSKYGTYAIAKQALCDERRTLEREAFIQTNINGTSKQKKDPESIEASSHNIYHKELLPQRDSIFDKHYRKERDDMLYHKFEFTDRE